MGVVQRLRKVGSDGRGAVVQRLRKVGSDGRGAGDEGVGSDGRGVGAERGGVRWEGCRG